MIGDMVSDVLAGTNANCCGSILLRNGKQLEPEDWAVARRYPNAHTLTQAVDWVLEHRFSSQPEAQLTASCA